MRLLRCRFWKSKPSRAPVTSVPLGCGGSMRMTSAPQVGEMAHAGRPRPRQRQIEDDDTGQRQMPAIGVV